MTMRAILLSAIGLLLHFTLDAQKVTVLHSSGGVEYFSSAKASPQKIYPGMELLVGGRIRCKKGATAKLLYNKKAFLVQGTQIQDISEVVQAGSGGESMSFGGRFLDFLTESLQASESNEKLQENHGRYMSKTWAAVKGFSPKDYSIRTELLAMGQLPPERVTFKWRSIAGTGPYTFNLLDESGSPVARILARDTLLTLDLFELALETQSEYQWQISRNNGQDLSAPLSFEIVPDCATKTQQSLEKIKDFQSADAAEKQLMLAYELERNRCNYLADDVYAKLLKKDPENLLLRRVFAAFLMRTNRLEASMEMRK